MKTILVVSYHYPPENSSCSEKNIRIVKLLLDNKYKVIVLTKPGVLDHGFEHPNLTILRTISTGVFHKASASQSCSSNQCAVSNGGIISTIKNFISLSVIPDGTIDWYNPAKRTIKKNKGLLKKCDCILSISSPYSAHIVSAFASKFLDIPFIMSYGDPWIYEAKRKRGWLRYRIEKYIEGSLLKKAASVLLITKWNKKKYIELYDLDPQKVATFHIGFDNADVLKIPHTKNNKLKILYGGSLDPVHRDPQPFLKAMRICDNIEVTIYCNDNHKVVDYIHEYGLENKVYLKPLIKSSEFNRLMYDYDALLLFGNKTPFQVPGKVFTYIAAGKTIIYLKNNDYPDDGTEEVLKTYGNTIISKNSEKAINECLKSIENTLNDIEIKDSSVFEFHNTMYPIIQAIRNVI